MIAKYSIRQYYKLKKISKKIWLLIKRRSFMNNEYYIGLDMGTNSVGWAVTDTKYKLLRAKGKDMWGVRLFDEAQTAAERRLYRVARRRRQREVARIGVLKELFEDAIAEVDPGFYHRLEESKYYEEDRSADNQQKFALFNDGLFTDKEYYDQYPTIFHLRKELIESTEPHDVRLVYLAVLNLFKRRGHFLNKGLDLSDSGSDMAAAYQTLLDEAEYQEIYFPQSVDPVALEQCLSERGLSRKGILENATQLLGINKKSKNEKPAYELLTMICGLKGTLAKIFGEEVLGEDNKKFSFSFRDSDYEEKAVEAVELIGEEAFALLAAAKEVHDIGLLAHILAGEKYLSMARVNQYNAHKADLYQLKYVLKKYDRHAYHEMFRTMSDNNYSAYVGSVNYKETKVRRNGGKGKSSDDFLKNLKKVLGKLPSAAHEDPDVQEIFDKIEVGDFLPKQLTGENGIIPNQVHARELKVILDNAAGYLPFLNEVDESGLTVAERILALFTFQIPYYVGPLGQQHAGEKGYNVWAKRRPGQEKGRILPWNFEEKIDTHQAAEDFILRMVRHCTYLQEESTLPKQSLLYEKFMVLNELNNLKINGEKPSIEVKQGIYTDLFETGKRVTGKKLLEYLRNRGLISSDETSTSVLSGIDGDFKASLSSLEKFRGVFGEDVKKDSVKEMIEQIIFWGTVFGDDKKFIRARLAEHYGDVLSSQQIKCISGMKFAGWGNLSREFLLMEGASKADGEYRALIDALWNTSDNLMELLSDRYTYKDVLHQRMQIAEKPLSEWTVEDLDGLYLSPSVRRMVWQTLKVLREVTAIQGGAPTRVFVEMARDDAQTQQRNKGKRSESRKAFLSALYKDDKEWVKFIDSHEERDFRIRKLYLYALQRGKCMYSGETIDIDNLMSDNSRYDIDHIYPQHFIKDDSLVNNLVLVKKEINNAGKGGHYPIAADIRQRMLPHWKHLKDINAISDEKYNRLRRSAPMTDEELAGFINRQIVETRQGTKAITQILQQAFPGEEVKVVFTKAGVASQFRQEFDITKVRSINDLHHAHDAYLNIIAGNVYNAKFTDNPYNFIRKAEKGKNYTYHMDKVFRGDVYRGNDLVWQAASKEAGTSGTIAFVKAQLDRKTVLI
ncbi:MAG: type II CRISPR RNA-guided endonuclease Cas9, partial [Peptococcaceae bacterium]|nr:type II CRISPR RNA-guided endonuclease Cas9 [Peptococcaceae bacterium]